MNALSRLLLIISENRGKLKPNYLYQGISLNCLRIIIEIKMSHVVIIDHRIIIIFIPMNQLIIADYPKSRWRPSFATDYLSNEDYLNI